MRFFKYFFPFFLFREKRANEIMKKRGAGGGGGGGEAKKIENFSLKGTF